MLKEDKTNGSDCGRRRKTAMPLTFALAFIAVAA
jgi:hypothetical protein